MKRTKRSAPPATKAQREPPLERQLTATFDPTISLYLQDMLDTRLYGASIGEVVDNLVCAGVREAIHSEHIKRRTFAKRST